MDKKDVLKAVKKLFDEAEDEYRWGGSEDSDGTLQRGFIDLVELRDIVLKLIESL